MILIFRKCISRIGGNTLATIREPTDSYRPRNCFGHGHSYSQLRQSDLRPKITDHSSSKTGEDKSLVAIYKSTD